MHSYLRQHPEIFMIPGTWEPHYFGSDVKHSYIRQWTEEAYLELFAGQNGEKLVGEKSGGYLASRIAAAEIKSFSPDAYIIAMLRNPVDMIYSFHSQALYEGWETIPDFREALMSKKQRSAHPWDRLSPDSPNFSGRIYWGLARYTEQLERYFDIFGREKVHVIIFDDLKRDTAAVYAETLGFLEVDANFQPDFVVENANKRRRFRFVHRPPSFVRAIGRAVIPKAWRKKVYEPIGRLNVTHEARQSMDPELRIRLQRKFAPEVEKLGALLGRDLSHWSRPDA